MSQIQSLYTSVNFSVVRTGIIKAVELFTGCYTFTVKYMHLSTKTHTHNENSSTESKTRKTILFIFSLMTPMLITCAPSF